MAGEADPNAQGAGDDGDQGGDGGEGNRTYTAAEVEAMVQGLKTKNSALIGRQKELQEKVKQWDGKDPAKVAQALEHLEKMEEEKSRAAGKFDELKNTLLDTHKREIGERDEKIAKTTARLYNIVGTKHAMEEIQKVASKSVALLLPHVERVLRVVEDDDGEFVPRIVDVKGNERIGPKGDPMTVSEYLAELSTKDEFAFAFDAPASTGSGARNARSQGNATGNVRISDADARDVVKYRAARAEAAKRGTQVEILPA